MSKFHVSCEGNIGAGKTTILNKLKIELQKRGINVTVLPEPVEKWTNWTFKNHSWNLLDLQYQNKEKFATPFQLVAGLTKFNQIRENVNGSGLLVERSLKSQQKIFVPYLDLPPLEMSIITNLLDTLTCLPSMEPDVFLYLRTLPSTAMSRVQMRGRPEEVGVTLDLLGRLHQAHEEWLLGSENRPVVVVENDVDDPDRVEDAVSRILNCLKI